MAGIKIEVSSYAIEYDKKNLKKVLGQAGREIASVARKLIRSSVGSGAKRGSRRASAPGQPPASQTGNLASSLAVKPSRDGLSVSIRDSAYYALFLEAGAKGGGGAKGNRNRRGRPSTIRDLQPRPFLSVALESREESISERIKAAVMDGIAFKKMK